MGRAKMNCSDQIRGILLLSFQAFALKRSKPSHGASQTP